jgi:NADH-quinone oxidoreductase subunit H
VAGFATEYSGMRFGFFFFAEYVNVFIISALTVTLYFGGWNAPFPFPEVSLALDPGGLGIGLLLLLAVAPVVGVVLLALPFWLLKPQWPAWYGLVIGFVLFNLLVVAAFFGWAYISFDWVAGLLWFLAKTYFFVFVFVWMRGTLPRVRIDQLMNFAWKWLMELAFLNIFITAGAIIVIEMLRS